MKFSHSLSFLPQWFIKSKLSALWVLFSRLHVFTLKNWVKITFSYHITCIRQVSCLKTRGKMQQIIKYNTESHHCHRKFSTPILYNSLAFSPQLRPWPSTNSSKRFILRNGKWKFTFHIEWFISAFFAKRAKVVSWLWGRKKFLRGSTLKLSCIYI